MKYDVQKLLQSKYSHSDSYYYSKTLNDFINSTRTKLVIEFYYTLSFNDQSECFRRYYFLSEISDKLHLFTEYYKYHNEIPRFFMPKLCDIMSNYHDKRRRIEYYRIKRVIEDENRRNPNKPKKAIVGDQPEPTKPTSPRPEKMYSKILSEIKDVSTTIESINKKLNAMKINAGELILQPSNRDQEQLQQFIQFLIEKQKQRNTQNTQTKNFNKLPIGVSQQTIKQIISRTQKNQSTFHLSPKPEEKLHSQVVGAQTHRISLNKMLSPVQLIMNSPTSSNYTTTNTQKPKQSLYLIRTLRLKQQSLSLQKKITETLRFPIKLHQHTRSDVRLYRK